MPERLVRVCIQNQRDYRSGPGRKRVRAAGIVDFECLSTRQNRRIRVRSSGPLASGNWPRISTASGSDYWNRRPLELLSNRGSTSLIFAQKLSFTHT